MTVLWFGWREEATVVRFRLERIGVRGMVVPIGILPHSTLLRVRMTAKAYRSGGGNVVRAAARRPTHAMRLNNETA
jgi:hypothetical protein